MMENRIKMDDLGVPLFLETPICCSQTASASTTHVPSTTEDAGFLSSTSDPDGGRDEGENSGDGELGWGVVLFSGMDLGFVESVMGLTGWWQLKYVLFSPLFVEDSNFD